MIKRFLTTILLFCSACGLFAAKEYMLVEKYNPEYSLSQCLFVLADRPVITYEYENGSYHFVVTNYGINKTSIRSFGLSDVKDYRFVVDTDIDDIPANILKIVSIDDETIEVQNVDSSDLVTLLSVNGVTVFRTKTDADGKAIVKLPSNKGVYILTVGNNSFKIIRK